MISAVGKLASMGLVGGTIAGASIAKPKTEKGEHNLNKFQTAVGLGALATTPYLVKEIVSTKPYSTLRIAHKTGEAIEKGTEFALKYGKKAVEYAKKAAATEQGSKVVSFAEKVINKFKNTKIGSKVIDKVGEIAKKVASNKTVQDVVAKATKALKDFSSSSATKKGVIGLVAAGTALLVYAGLKTITNYYKKEGAIEQKYDDLHKKYERMLKIDPITNAQTGEPISFEEYCKLAQTMVK